MGPIGVFIYIWYLDTFDMVYKKEDVPPPCSIIWEVPQLKFAY